MGLPLDEYIVLDERFVSRTPDGFRLALPLAELRIGEKRPLSDVEACVECDLSVKSDGARRENTISGSRFRFTFDESALEQIRATAAADELSMKAFRTRVEGSGGANGTANGTAAAAAADIIISKTFPPQAPPPGLPAALDVSSQGAPESGADRQARALEASAAMSEDERKALAEQQAKMMAAQQKRALEITTAMSEDERESLNGAAQRGMARALAAAGIEASGDAVISWGAKRDTTASAAADDDGEAGRQTKLRGKLELEVALNLPAPLSYVPPVVLNPFGSLLLKATWGKILPRVLELVAADYTRRVCGGGAASAAGGGLMGTSVADQQQPTATPSGAAKSEAGEGFEPSKLKRK